jgi:hypothetical protein
VPNQPRAKAAAFALGVVRLGMVAQIEPGSDGIGLAQPPCAAHYLLRGRDGKNEVPVKLKFTFTNLTDRLIEFNAHD